MHKNQSGFSLIELLVYIFILSSLVLITTNLFMSLNNGRAQAEARADVDSNLRFALEKISQDIRSASSITTPNLAGATSTSLILIASSSTITYNVSSGKLRRQVDSGTPEDITSDRVEVNISDFPLTFTRLENINSVFDPPKTNVSIEISMKIRHKNDGPQYQYAESKKTTITIR